MGWWSAISLRPTSTVGATHTALRGADNIPDWLQKQGNCSTTQLQAKRCCQDVWHTIWGSHLTPRFLHSASDPATLPERARAIQGIRCSLRWSEHTETRLQGGFRLSHTQLQARGTGLPVRCPVRGWHHQQEWLQALAHGAPIRARPRALSEARRRHGHEHHSPTDIPGDAYTASRCPQACIDKAI